MGDLYDKGTGELTITEWLRISADVDPAYTAYQCERLRAAADQINRLRAELDDMSSASKRIYANLLKYGDIIERARHNLGRPGPGYPAPVAVAISILDEIEED